jgi:seryl-tRNA synthetase
MGRNTIFREIEMDNLNSDLDLLENLSKKISDLIYNNEFAHISYIDAKRRALIEKIKQSESNKNDIKKRIETLVEKNIENVKTTEKKLQHLSKNHNKFNKRLKAYSFNK